MPFNTWKERYFDIAARGGRPGRPGGPAQVRARQMLAKEGYTNVEHVALGPHFPDMVRANSKGGLDYVEVGASRRNGKPVSRERKKLAVEVRSLGERDNLIFVDKNNLSRRIIYRKGDSPD